MRVKKTPKSRKPIPTGRQKLFVEHYLISMNGADAVRAAGYQTRNPRCTASELLSKPHIQEAIDKGIADRVARLHITQDYVLLKLAEIAQSNIGDYLHFDHNGVRLRDMDEIPPEKIALIKELTEGEDKNVKLVLHDKISALDKLARHLGMFERHRQRQTRQSDFTRQILTNVRDKKIDPTEAALTLEAEGYPLPESLRLLLAKAEPEPPSDDNGAYATISPEEMAERAKARMEAAEAQRTGFVPERAEQVRQMKDEMGGGSFQPERVSDGEKDS